MSLKLNRSYLHNLKFDLRSPLFINAAIILALLVLAALLRFNFRHFIDNDYTCCLSPWYEFIKSHGLHAFKDNFANYNFPYLYLIWLSTFLPISKILAIKLIAIAFDFLMAGGIYLVVNQLKKNRLLGVIAAVVALFLPTVFTNSAMWGQCDSIYTTFLIYSFYLVLKKKYKCAWFVWGIAFAFKLQAAFFLPILVFVWFKKNGGWYSPALAFIAPVMAIIPAILVGRSLSSALSVYSSQYNFFKVLSFNAPNFYQWIPNTSFSLFNTAGLIIALSASAILLFAAVNFLKYNEHNLLLLAAAFLFLVPFFLPQMHERYFYAGEIFALILAFSVSRLALVALVAEVIGFFVYIPYLFPRAIPIPFDILALGELGIIAYLIGRLFVTGPKPNITD
jgi:Gpi18-like mannosyltransferase